MTERKTLPWRMRFLPALLLAAASLAGSALAQEALASFAGEYVRDNPENDWHEVTIEAGKDGGTLLWKNAAGHSWTLEFHNNGEELRSSRDCPYGEQKLGIQRDKAGKPIALQFNNETYRRHWEYGHEEGWPYMGDPKVQSPTEVPKRGGSNHLPGAYEKMKVKNVVNNGHAFQLNYADGGGGLLETGNQKFKLLQFHFHSPSEHKQTDYAGWTDESGKKYPGHYAMEVHFVHTDGSFKGDGKAAPQRDDLAVVGVFIKEGAHNAALQKVWDESPETEGEDTDLAFDGFDASELMPKGSNFQTYVGSLTTPPLSSGVSWFVMDEPIEASPEQIRKLRAAMKHNTNRSIQGRLDPNARRR